MTRDFNQQRAHSREIIFQQAEEIKQLKGTINDQTAVIQRQAEQLTNSTSNLDLAVQKNIESNLELVQEMRSRAQADQKLATALAELAAARSEIVEYKAERLVKDALGHRC